MFQLFCPPLTFETVLAECQLERTTQMQLFVEVMLITLLTYDRRKRKWRRKLNLSATTGDTQNLITVRRYPSDIQYYKLTSCVLPIPYQTEAPWGTNTKPSPIFNNFHRKITGPHLKLFSSARTIRHMNCLNRVGPRNVQ